MAFTCPCCMFAFESPRLLAEHVESRAAATASPLGHVVHAFGCPLCTAQFTGARAFAEHLLARNGLHVEVLDGKSAATTRVNVVPDNASGNGEMVKVLGARNTASEARLICEHCLRPFKRAWDLKRHLRTHSDERPFECSACGKRFRLKSTLLDHSRTHAEDETRDQHACAVCARKFLSRSALRLHWRVHTGDLPFACAERNCTSTFRTRKLMLTHLRNAHGDAEVDEAEAERDASLAFDALARLNRSSDHGGRRRPQGGEKRCGCTKARIERSARSAFRSIGSATNYDDQQQSATNDNVVAAAAAAVHQQQQPLVVNTDLVGEWEPEACVARQWSSLSMDGEQRQQWPETAAASFTARRCSHSAATGVNSSGYQWSSSSATASNQQWQPTATPVVVNNNREQYTPATEAPARHWMVGQSGGERQQWAPATVAARGGERQHWAPATVVARGGERQQWAPATIATRGGERQQWTPATVAHEWPPTNCNTRPAMPAQCQMPPTATFGFQPQQQQHPFQSLMVVPPQSRAVTPPGAASMTLWPATEARRQLFGAQSCLPSLVRYEGYRFEHSGGGGVRQDGAVHGEQQP